MRHRWPIAYWLVLIAALSAAGWFGSRWLIAQYYPLEYRTDLFTWAEEYDLDPYLVAAVIRNESRFRPRATSPEGARGLMQVMPETGEDVARELDLPFSADLLYDPAYNIRIGSWYLAHLQEEFGGDTVLALAAYNGGRQNVKNWLATRQWTGEHRTISQIPFPETRQYVERVMRDHDRYQRIYAPQNQAGGVTTGGGEALPR